MLLGDRQEDPQASQEPPVSGALTPHGQKSAELEQDFLKKSMEIQHLFTCHCTVACFNFLAILCELLATLLLLFG